MRKFLRIPVVIPVRVMRASVSPGGAVEAAMPGILLNIGRGGGRLRVRGRLPLHTRLVVFLPVHSGSCLAAEVVWTTGSGEHELLGHGVRWLQPLTSQILGEILLGQTHENMGEVSHAPCPGT